MFNYLLEEKLPEEVYVQNALVPFVVFDFQVHAHSINNYLESIFLLEDYPESMHEQIVKACWAIRLNRGPDMLPQMDFTGIVVDDYKIELDDATASTSGYGYWRHIVAREEGLQEYKLGRATHTELFNEVKRIGYEYILSPRSTFYYYRQPLMEADDIAGKLARIKRTSQDSFVYNRHMLLWTVDGDWQGLVNNNCHIYWANTGPWLPRLRDEQAVIDYYLRKNKVVINHAEDCYMVKVDQGDAGDGLIPGSPLRLFDLIEEDSVYNFSEQETSELELIIKSNRISNRPDHLDKSVKFLASLGLVCPIYTPSDEKDIEAFHEKAKKERDLVKNPPLRGRFKKDCEDIKVVDQEFYDKCAEFTQKDNIEKENLSLAKRELEKCERHDTDCIRYFKLLIKQIQATRDFLKNEVKNLQKILKIHP